MPSPLNLQALLAKVAVHLLRLLRPRLSLLDGGAKLLELALPDDDAPRRREGLREHLVDESKPRILRRREDGRYERCQPEHSWNASNVVSNLLLFQLQRHSDHHAHASRSYQALRHSDDAPQLPSGYMGMILLAYVPPLWFRVMDPRVRAHYGGELARANLAP